MLSVATSLGLPLARAEGNILPSAPNGLGCLQLGSGAMPCPRPNVNATATVGIGQGRLWAWQCHNLGVPATTHPPPCRHTTPAPMVGAAHCRAPQAPRRHCPTLLGLWQAQTCRPLHQAPPCHVPHGQQAYPHMCGVPPPSQQCHRASRPTHTCVGGVPPPPSQQGCIRVMGQRRQRH